MELPTWKGAYCLRRVNPLSVGLFNHARGVLYDQRWHVAGAEMKSHLSLGASQFWASYTVIFMSERYLYSYFIRGNLSTNRSRYINYQSNLFCELILGLKILGVKNTIPDFDAVHLAYYLLSNVYQPSNQS